MTANDIQGFLVAGYRIQDDDSLTNASVEAGGAHLLPVVAKDIEEAVLNAVSLDPLFRPTGCLTLEEIDHQVAMIEQVRQSNPEKSKDVRMQGFIAAGYVGGDDSRENILMFAVLASDTETATRDLAKTMSDFRVAGWMPESVLKNNQASIKAMIEHRLSQAHALAEQID